MRILLITPTLLMGGTERFILNFVKVFGKDHSLELAYYKTADTILINCFEELGCKIIALPYYVKHPICFIKELSSLYKEKYDLVYIHANSSLSVLYSFPVWKNKTKTKVMYHSHNTSGGNKWLQAAGRIILNRICYKQFACSVDASVFMYGHKDAQIINNVIDIKDYIPNSNTRSIIRHELGVSDDEIVIGHIGRFNRQKNHLFLISVFSEYLKIQSNSKLLLIGEGETKSEIRKKICEIGISDKVIILGTTEKAKEYYQGMDLFLLPSLYEGLPFVGIESQASGTPCLIADTIPSKIKITPIVYFQSLDDGPSVWAKRIIEIVSNTPDKNDYSDLIESSGYGLKHLVTDYSTADVGLTIND